MPFLFLFGVSAKNRDFPFLIFHFSFFISGIKVFEVQQDVRGFNLEDKESYWSLLKEKRCGVYTASPKGSRPAVLRLVNRALTILIGRFSGLIH
jgi:hypothetical protein